MQVISTDTLNLNGSSLSTEILNPLTKILGQYPHVAMDYREITSTQKEKIDLLAQNHATILQLMSDQGLITPDSQIQIAASKTLTGIYSDQPFIVTVFGEQGLSRNEKKAILSALGHENPSRDQVEQILWDTEGSYVDLKELGVDIGFVGPLLNQNQIPRLFIDRQWYLENKYNAYHPVWAELALSQSHGLILPLETLGKTIAEFDQAIKSEPVTIHISNPDPNRSIFQEPILS